MNQLTLLPVESLVSHTVKPGSNEAQQMTVTSGRNIAALLQSTGPVGRLLRMCLESDIPSSTIFYLTWKVWTTKQGRLLFRLAPSMPRTSESGSSYWHTPNVPNGGRVTPVGMTPTGKMPDGRKRQVGLEHQVRMVEKGYWSTPKALDAFGIETSPQNHAQYGTGMTLTQAARRSTWPTPAARDYRSPNTNGNFQDQLPNVVGGQLNPDWVEWLMGLPVGWTNLQSPE